MIKHTTDIDIGVTRRTLLKAGAASLGSVAAISSAYCQVSMMSVPAIVQDTSGSGWAGRVAGAKILSAAAGTCIAICGDSRATCFPSTRFGQYPVIDIGMPGIYIRDSINYCAQAFANARSAVLAVVQIGINNIWLPAEDQQWATLRQDVTSLIANFLATGKGFIFTTPWPLERGFDRPDSAVIAWCQNAAAISNIIIECCYDNRVPCVNLNRIFRQSDLTLLYGMSSDGVHPSPFGVLQIVKALSPTVFASARQIRAQCLHPINGGFVRQAHRIDKRARPISSPMPWLK